MKCVVSRPGEITKQQDGNELLISPSEGGALTYMSATESGTNFSIVFIIACKRPEKPASTLRFLAH